MSLLLGDGPHRLAVLDGVSTSARSRQRSGKIEPGKPLTPADSQYLNRFSLSQSAKAMPTIPRLPQSLAQSVAIGPEQAELMAQPQYF